MNIAAAALGAGALSLPRAMPGLPGSYGPEEFRNQGWGFRFRGLGFEYSALKFLPWSNSSASYLEVHGQL